MKNCEKCGYGHTVINITLKDAVGENTLCPNCLAVAFLNNKLHFVNNLDLICDITGKRGAVEFISEHEYYCLNSKAMLRLISHNLKPREYKILAKKYGEYQYMLHDDFYSENGFALQPLGEDW